MQNTKMVAFQASIGDNLVSNLRPDLKKIEFVVFGAVGEVSSIAIGFF